MVVLYFSIILISFIILGLVFIIGFIKAINIVHNAKIKIPGILKFILKLASLAFNIVVYITGFIWFIIETINL